ncbi:hypothetical protein NDU88_002210, partial [Pleurodeles waltl]
MDTLDENRDTLLQELFKTTPQETAMTNTNIPHKEGLKMKFVRLERLKKQELSRWWDYTILQKYIEIKQITRGLWVILFPSFEDLSPELLKEWEQLLIRSSYGMMDILVRDAIIKRNKLLKDIYMLEKAIQETNLTEVIEKNYMILRDVLQKHQQYIKERKLRKLRKDANNYRSGNVFTYIRKYDNIKIDKQADTNQIPHDELASIASTRDSELSSISSRTSDDLNSSNRQLSNVVTNKSPFLVELERCPKGQKPSHPDQQVHIRESEEGRGKTKTIEKDEEGVTTRAASRNQVL